MGSGLICSKGQPPQRLQVGDIVHIPAGETHWHGGTKETIMAHLAISLGSEFRLLRFARAFDVAFASALSGDSGFGASNRGRVLCCIELG